MRKVIFIFVLLALVAPFAAADGAPAADTELVTAGEAPAEAPEFDADAFFAELDGTMEAEEKYECRLLEGAPCSTASDCQDAHGWCFNRGGWECQSGSSGSSAWSVCICC